ncbi:MAG: class I SAM-dependent methyltransferase family protein, partial [Halalkalicoccus sp.]
MSANDAAPLAAIVPKEKGDEAIAALRAEGVYDDSRKVREAGEDALAIAVTDPPEGLDVHDVIRQADPEARATGSEDLVADRGW